MSNFMVKTEIDEFSAHDLTMMTLAGELMFDDSMTATVTEDGIFSKTNDVSQFVSFDDFIFQPPSRKEVLYDVVKVRDKFYLNVWGRTSVKYCLITITSPNEEVLRKYTIRLSRLKNSLF